MRLTLYSTERETAGQTFKCPACRLQFGQAGGWRVVSFCLLPRSSQPGYGQLRVYFWNIKTYIRIHTARPHSFLIILKKLKESLPLGRLWNTRASQGNSEVSKIKRRHPCPQESSKAGFVSRFVQTVYILMTNDSLLLTKRGLTRLARFRSFNY